MKDLKSLDNYRVDMFGDGNLGDSSNGAFLIKIRGEQYFVIAGTGNGWEHVSISNYKNKHKTPSWAVMCELNDLFFEDEEVAMQLHPKKSEYVNMVNALHLWRPIDKEIPTPPSWMVGVK